jgi:hypothetical protein
MENQIVEQKPNPKIEKIFKGVFWFLIVGALLVVLSVAVNIFYHCSGVTTTNASRMISLAPPLTPIYLDILNFVPPLFAIFLLGVFMINISLYLFGKFYRSSSMFIYNKNIKKLLITSCSLFVLLIIVVIIVFVFNSFGKTRCYSVS